jgi:hypothetical protein
MPTAQRFCPTAILFGSAARRCSWENRIICYQMTVLIERVVQSSRSVAGEIFRRRSRERKLTMECESMSVNTIGKFVDVTVI